MFGVLEYRELPTSGSYSADELPYSCWPPPIRWALALQYNIVYSCVCVWWYDTPGETRARHPADQRVQPSSGGSEVNFNNQRRSGLLSPPGPTQGPAISWHTYVRYA